MTPRRARAQPQLPSYMLSVVLKPWSALGLEFNARQRTGATQWVDRDIELDGILGAYTFLLEILFVRIFDIHPDGRQAAFRELEASILGMLERTPANPVPTSARAVEVSDEVEKQLRIFLTRLALRVRP